MISARHYRKRRFKAAAAAPTVEDGSITEAKLAPAVAAKLVSPAVSSLVTGTITGVYTITLDTAFGGLTYESGHIYFLNLTIYNQTGSPDMLRVKEGNNLLASAGISTGTVLHDESLTVAVNGTANITLSTTNATFRAQLIRIT